MLQKEKIQGEPEVRSELQGLGESLLSLVELVDGGWFLGVVFLDGKRGLKKGGLTKVNSIYVEKCPGFWSW